MHFYNIFKVSLTNFFPIVQEKKWPVVSIITENSGQTKGKIWLVVSVDRPLFQQIVCTMLLFIFVSYKIIVICLLTIILPYSIRPLEEVCLLLKTLFWLIFAVFAIFVSWDWLDRFLYTILKIKAFWYPPFMWWIPKKKMLIHYFKSDVCLLLNSVFIR